MLQLLHVLNFALFALAIGVGVLIGYISCHEKLNRTEKGILIGLVLAVAVILTAFIREVQPTQFTKGKVKRLEPPVIEKQEVQVKDFLLKPKSAEEHAAILAEKQREPLPFLQSSSSSSSK